MKDKILEFNPRKYYIFLSTDIKQKEPEHLKQEINNILLTTMVAK